MVGGVPVARGVPRLDLDEQRGPEGVDDVPGAVQDAQLGALHVDLDEVQAVQPGAGAQAVQGVDRDADLDLAGELGVRSQPAGSAGQERPAGHHAIAADGHAHHAVARFGAEGQRVVPHVGGRARPEQPRPGWVGKRQRFHAVHLPGRPGQPGQRYGVQPRRRPHVDAHAARPDQAAQAQQFRLHVPDTPGQRHDHRRRQPYPHRLLVAHGADAREVRPAARRATVASLLPRCATSG
jgi:hypothetical protein